MAGARFLDPSSVPLKRQSGGNIWATLLPLIQVAIIIAILAVVGMLFLPVFQKQSRLREEKANLEEKIAAAQEKQQQLQLETEHMKNDPAYVEHIARDRLSMGRPGETIVRFDSYQSSPTTSKVVSPTPENDPASN